MPCLTEDKAALVSSVFAAIPLKLDQFQWCVQ